MENGTLVVCGSIMKRDDFSLLEKCILGKVKSFNDGNKDCTISNKTFAQMFQHSRRDMVRAVNRLVKRGLLDRKILPNGRILSISSDMKTLLSSDGETPLDTSSDTASPQVVTPRHSSSDTVSPKKTYRRHIDTSQYSETFKKFWQLYPRKLNKKGTYKKWKAQGKKGATVKEIMKATENYVKITEGKESQFVLHPSTFLGPDDRWQDYLEIKEQKRYPDKKCDTCGRIVEDAIGFHCAYCEGTLEVI
jgi:hypothetical protein